MVVRLAAIVAPVERWLNAPHAGMWRSGLAGGAVIAVYVGLAAWSGINSLAVLGAVGGLAVVVTHGRGHQVDTE